MRLVNHAAKGVKRVSVLGLNLLLHTRFTVLDGK
jgi:hypothetical protein